MSAEVQPGRAGGLRLILLRFLATLLLLVPAVLAARHAMGDGPGRDPQVVAAGIDHATIGMVSRLVRESGPAFAAAAGAALFLFILFDQLLSGAALILLARERDESGRTRVWRTIWDDSIRYLPGFLRLLLTVAILSGIGAALIGRPFDKLSAMAVREGWLATTTIAVTSLGRALVVILWVLLLGAIARWTRVLMVADDHRRVRRVFTAGLRVSWRCPFRTALYFIFVPLLLQLMGGALLGIMTTRIRGPLEEQLMLCGAWAGYLLLQSTIWYVLLHRARVLLDLDRFDDIRATSDQPFWRSLFSGRRRQRKRKKRSKSPPLPPAVTELEMDIGG